MDLAKVPGSGDGGRVTKEDVQKFVGTQAHEMVQHYYDLGIAVGASSGLVVPVLRDADAMSFWDIEVGIKDFARRAEDGTRSLEEIKGGTFTITNGGQGVIRPMMYVALSYDHRIVDGDNADRTVQLFIHTPFV